MYSIDINLLGERAESQTGKQANFKDQTIAKPQYGKTPLYVGAGVAVLALLAAGGGWLWTGQQTTQLEARQKDLDRQLGSLKVQEQRLQQVTAQVTQVTDESQSLASVFDQVHPWSAVLQDLRENTPQGVQIANVVQGEAKAIAAAPAPVTVTPSSGGLINKISTPPNPEAKLSPNPAPVASPTTTTVPTLAGAKSTPTRTSTATLPADVPSTTLEITGTAKSFEEVNNFVLTLKQSAFFNPDDTQLLSSSSIESGALTRIDPIRGKELISTAEQKKLDDLKLLKLPKVIEYKIHTSLQHIPSTDLIRELERKGAVGLVTRLRTLQKQQTIKP
jgi:type IV pilus assembly protein PilN